MEFITDSTGIKGAVESLIGGRNENQDSYAMAETRLGLLVIVCDGMGGGPAGKTASSLAAQAIIDYVSGAVKGQNPMSVLKEAVVSANESMLRAIDTNPDYRGMGTTCVCVLMAEGNGAYIVHVGDSRAYQIRDGKVVFRTEDHSYVAEMVRRGLMTEEDARTSQYSNVINRAIGTSPEVDPEVDVVEYKPGDRFALMTDGIWGTMPQNELVKLLTHRSNPEQLVGAIATHVDALGENEGGGHDNLTIAIVDVPRDYMTHAVKPAPPVVETVDNSSATPTPTVAPVQPERTEPKDTRITAVNRPEKQHEEPRKYEREDVKHSSQEPVKKKRIPASAYAVGIILLIAAGLFVWFQSGPKTPEVDPGEFAKEKIENAEAKERHSATEKVENNSSANDNLPDKTNSSETENVTDKDKATPNVNDDNVAPENVTSNDSKESNESVEKNNNTQKSENPANTNIKKSIEDVVKSTPTKKDSGITEAGNIKLGTALTHLLIVYEHHPTGKYAVYKDEKKNKFTDNDLKKERKIILENLNSSLKECTSQTKKNNIQALYNKIVEDDVFKNAEPNGYPRATTHDKVGEYIEILKKIINN